MQFQHNTVYSTLIAYPTAVIEMINCIRIHKYHYNYGGSYMNRIKHLTRLILKLVVIGTKLCKDCEDYV